jgi:hypothetical protein
MTFGRTDWNFPTNDGSFYRSLQYLSIDVYYLKFNQVHEKLWAEKGFNYIFASLYFGGCNSAIALLKNLNFWIKAIQG